MTVHTVFCFNVRVVTQQSNLHPAGFNLAFTLHPFIFQLRDTARRLSSHTIQKIELIKIF